MKEKLEPIRIFWKKLNKFDFMRVVRLTFLALIIWLIIPLVHLDTVWRVGLIFFGFNCVLAYLIGYLINLRQISKTWIFFFPLVFALAVTLVYPKYNYLLSIVYLCFELFGLWQDDLYHIKRRR